MTLGKTQLPFYYKRTRRAEAFKVTAQVVSGKILVSVNITSLKTARDVTACAPKYLTVVKYKERN